MNAFKGACVALKPGSSTGRASALWLRGSMTVYDYIYVRTVGHSWGARQLLQIDKSLMHCTSRMRERAHVAVHAVPLAAPLPLALMRRALPLPMSQGGLPSEGIKIKRD